MVDTLRTRKPTGLPSWPILLLAGAEKTGKSYSAAVAASSDLVGRTYWVSIGEDDPDEYGQLGDFDIVEHDGTYRGVLAAIQAAGREPLPEEGVPLLIVDSMTRLWDQIKDHAQQVANDRAKRKNKGSQDQDAQVTMDLWNAAADQWQNVMDAIRRFPGPSILTARLDSVAVVNEQGQPTPKRESKVQAHKTLPYDAGAVVEMPARGETWLTGVRSVRVRLPERLRVPDFTVDGLWRKLGLEDAQTSPRVHTPPRVDAPPAERWRTILTNTKDTGELRAVWIEINKAGQLDLELDGRTIRDIISARKTLLEQEEAATRTGHEQPSVEEQAARAAIRDPEPPSA